MRQVILVWVSIAIGAGCGQTEPRAQAREQASALAMSIEVDDVDAASIDARQIAEAGGGFVAESRVDASGASLALHVPASTLEETRASLARLGRVRSTSEETEDVTLVHADVNTRLDGAHAEEARLTAMFADRTNSLADVLAVEHELSRVRIEIAQHDAEERALSDRVAMARVSLDLVRVAPAFTSAPTAFVSDCATSGARLATTLALALLGALAFTAPFLLACLAATSVWRAIRKRVTRA